MNKIYYDLHIHTALSPCADNDMLPCDIVSMALINGLDVIAVTDHNTMGNVRAVIEAAGNTHDIPGRENGSLVVLPGIEVTTAEEVHVVCLFEDTGPAFKFESELSAYYADIKNREEIFGEQLLCGSDDTILGKTDRLLPAATTISFHDLYELTQKYGGAFVPAHVDRGSFSVMSNLGALPPDLGIAAVEYTSRGVFGERGDHDFSLFPGKKYIYSSDAHQLHAINEKVHFIELPEKTPRAIIGYLRLNS